MEEVNTEGQHVLTGGQEEEMELTEEDFNMVDAGAQQHASGATRRAARAQGGRQHEPDAHDGQTELAQPDPQHERQGDGGSGDRGATALIDEVITLQNEATFGVFNTLFLGDVKELAQAQQLTRLEQHKDTLTLCNLFFQARGEG